jgi:hypothetical protein
VTGILIQLPVSTLLTVGLSIGIFFFIFKVSETAFCARPEIIRQSIRTRYIDWAQLSRLLPEDGDNVQSPKRSFNLKKTARWIMSKKSIIEINYMHVQLKLIYVFR